MGKKDVEPINRQHLNTLPRLHTADSQEHRWTGQTGRQTVKNVDRPGKYAGRQAEKQSNSRTDRHRRKWEKWQHVHLAGPFSYTDDAVALLSQQPLDVSHQAMLPI